MGPLENLLFEVYRSFSGKRWLERANDVRASLALSQQYDLPEIIGRILTTRGIGADDVDNFLDPRLSNLLPDPAHLLDMDKAVARLVEAIVSKQNIAIFGDYDVDGATSSALLARYFTVVDRPARIYIPDRLSEGYGPNVAAMNKLREEGIDLVITVDCGTTSYEPLEVAKETGLDVIVVDHHAAEAGLPKAAAVINPNRIDEDSPHRQLAAVGVTFLVVVGMNRGLREAGYFKKSDLPEPDLMQWLDLVALGTVADMVALTGVNRALVVQGLKIMKRRQNAGISALANAAGIDEAPAAYHLGFIFGPRVNAGGRVGESYLGANLLTSDDPLETKVIAEKLEDYNKERRDIEDTVLTEAVVQAEQQSGDSMIFVAGEGWHPGVLGIVASRLKERFGVPACVVSTSDGKATGSARSVSGVDLGACVIAARQKGLLTNGGGHTMAAGFSLSLDNLPKLHDFLLVRIKKRIEEANIQPTLHVDGALTIAGASMNLVKKLQQLEPFGTGNAEPRFGFSNVRVTKSDQVGESHVRCFFADASNASLAGISFRSLETDLGRALLSHVGQPLHVVGRLRENAWQGRSSVQLFVDDAAPIH